MENLILNIAIGYFITGGILSAITDISIRLIKVSPPFTFKDVIIVALIWPTVISVLVTDYLNGDF
jgi:hypothetical protein